MTDICVAQVVGMTDCRTGKTAYAVWVGTGMDPINKNNILGARLLNVYPNKRIAEEKARDYLRAD